jgi:hypothetical protein
VPLTERAWFRGAKVFWIARNGITRYDGFMPRGTPFSRIAITLPAEDLAAADRLAAEQDRSRSWIVAEALRQYVAAQCTEAAGQVLDPSRREQLRRDLALSPTERVLAAERSVHVVGPDTLSTEEPIIFADFDAFLAWSRQQPTAL